MRKNDCNVIRDLLPLVLDRVSSDESREAVEVHIANCEECRNQYDAMKAALPDEARTEYEEEQKKIVDALKTMRKRKLKQRIVSIVMAVVICAAAAFGGMYAYELLYNRYSVAVDNDLYSLSLAQLQDGRIVVTADAFGINFDTASASSERREDGRNIVYLRFTTAPVHRVSHMPYNRTKTVMNVLGSDPEHMIDEIRQGDSNNYISIWSHENPIPAASEEMEKFFALEQQANAWFQSQHITEAEYYAWQERMEAAYTAVPEWQ